MARPKKTAATKPAAASAPVALAPTKAGKARPVPPPAPAVKAGSGRGRPAPVATPAAAPTRVPPSSKGELRAHIEKLEAANAALKAKGREANRNAKVAVRRIAELEAKVSQFEADTVKVRAPAAPAAPPAAEAKTARRGRPPGRSKWVDPGDAVPPGVAVQTPEPLDEEAAAARNALEENLSEK